MCQSGAGGVGESLANNPLLRIRGLSKSYGGILALKDVSLDVAEGEVHGLCGENGAGKSTLIKILTGVVHPDGGDVQFAGRALDLGSVASSQQAGIAVMHQESTAFPDLNAVDNLFVGRELTGCGSWLLDHAQMRRSAVRVFERLGEHIDLRQPVGDLPLAQRQMVAMARAMLSECRLLIMDEPTSSLSARETQVLLRSINQLRHEGVSVLYVSHRLEELFQISDRITVLRDGHWVTTRAARELSPQQLVQLMVGREIAELTGRHGRVQTESKIALDVRNLTRSGAFEDICFTVRKGEVVGLAGLVGAGRSEVARALFGVDRYDTGQVLIDQQSLAPGSVAAAIAAGVALVPEDRQREGLVLPMSASANVSLAILKRLQHWGLVDAAREQEVVQQQLTSLRVKAAGASTAAAALSGGNQQKLVIGKWLASRPRVLILDEPTRGIDVGAKAQVHRLVRQLADDGIATLVISSELPELLSISDRILVMRQGRLVGEVTGQSAQQADVLRMALPDSLCDAAEAGKADSHGTTQPTARRGSPAAPGTWRRESGLMALIMAISLVVSWFDANFMSLANMKDIIVRAAPTAIVACGVMLVIVTAEIDISVGSLMALLAAVMGIILSADHWAWPTWVGIPLVLLLGTFCGLLTGSLVTIGRVPSIIVTLGLLTGLRGLTTWIMGGENIDGLPVVMSDLCKKGVLTVPISVWAAFVVITVSAIIGTQTPLGRRLYAVGSNAESAATAGLSQRRLKLFVFAYTGFLTALATLVDVPRLPKIETGIGLEFELLVVTCVVVGGVSVAGGRGSLLGVVLAVILMTMIRPVLTYMDVGEAGEKWTKAIQGLFIMLAVVSDSVFGRWRWTGHR
jgi:rhamnose transport system ATP-binding protein